MKILITGGLGRIGSYLTEALSKKNEITVLDNFSNANKDQIQYPIFSNKADHILSTIQNTNSDEITIINGDIRDNNIINIINKNEIIIHTAAQTNVNRSLENPIFDSDNNIGGTLNILDISRKSNVKRFIYISSAAVYGIPIYLPIDEKHPTEPISPYGLSKLTGERYSMLFYNLYGVPVTCIRLFNVFGLFSNSNDSYSGVITKFIDRVRNNKSPIIFGDGNQTRDFIYINDIVNTISKIIENNETIGEVYNIGTGNPTRIIDLAKIIIDKFDKKVEPELSPAKIGDIKDSYANINKIKKIVSPNYSFGEGLEDMIAKINSQNH